MAVKKQVTGCECRPPLRRTDCHELVSDDDDGADDDDDDDDELYLIRGCK